jgi:hypothetical protein
MEYRVYDVAVWLTQVRQQFKRLGRMKRAASSS